MSEWALLAARPLFARAQRTLVCYYAGANGGKGTCSGAFDPGTLSNTGSLISHSSAGDTHVRALGRGRHDDQTTSETTYESRRFFFFDDFFSFFFDDGTGVSSGFLFPATWTSAPDEGDAPAAVPKR